jgi:hypothetical protein
MNLQDLKNKTILLFGKSRAFSSEEFDSQMRHHNIEVVQEYNEDVDFIVDGRMMTPYEQNTSEALYNDKKAPFIFIDELEKELCIAIDEDTLLMSLKLSHDKERLKAFLLNTMISDRLFFRLLKMYKWDGEDFFENDDNRDVSAAFIGRFYENIERNHNVEYSTSGFIHLISQTKNKELLEMIAMLEPIKYHPKIESAIAMSIYIDEAMQKKFYKTQKPNLLEALSLNKNLSKELVEIFLEDENLGKNVAQSKILNDNMFQTLQRYSTSLALNESLDLEMQKKLLSLNETQINYALALNNNLDESIVKKLFEMDDENIKQRILENRSTPIEILSEAYKEEKNHLSLCKNENTPIEILYQLQLDSRYERYVKANAGYGKHIQTENIGWLM